MKNTKRALFMSVLSMLLCIAMLAGSTFAWFTDTVTSGKNKIVAGNLDVELKYNKNLLKPDYKPVGTTTNIFDKDALWEPGRVEVVNLQVVNEGTLALSYALSVSKAGELGVDKEGVGGYLGKRVLSEDEFNDEFRNKLLKGKEETDFQYEQDTETLNEKTINIYIKRIDLSKYLKYAVINKEVTMEELAAAGEDYRAELLKMAEKAGSHWVSEGINVGGQDELLEPGKSKELTLVVYMPPEIVANEANYRLSPADKMKMDGLYKELAGAGSDAEKLAAQTKIDALKDKYRPIINLGVNVFATQTPYESDSFGDDYDEGALDLVPAAAVARAIKTGAENANATLEDKYGKDEQGNRKVYFDGPEEEDVVPTLTFHAPMLVALKEAQTLTGIIEDAVEGQAKNIRSIQIGVGTPKAKTRELNGSPVNEEGWVYNDLKAVFGTPMDAITAIGNGVQVEIIDMNGGAQIYQIKYMAN